jgi:hypothetical protein
MVVTEPPIQAVVVLEALMRQMLRMVEVAALVS